MKKEIYQILLILNLLIMIIFLISAYFFTPGLMGWGRSIEYPDYLPFINLICALIFGITSLLLVIFHRRGQPE